MSVASGSSVKDLEKQKFFDDTSGDVTVRVGSTSGGIDTNDNLSGTGVFSELTIGTSAVEGKIGASVLVGRKAVIFQALDKGIFMAEDASITTSNGIEIFKSQFFYLPFGAAGIFFIGTGAGLRLRFQEVL